MGRTNIVIDESLIQRVMALFGVQTKRQAVDIALRQAANRGSAAAALRRLRGKLEWSGDIDAWRRSRR